MTPGGAAEKAGLKENDVIVEIAREESVDLIVMGISHQNRPNESPLGRVAEHVVRNAHCEVVVDRVPRQKVTLIPSELT